MKKNKYSSFELIKFYGAQNILYSSIKYLYIYIYIYLNVDEVFFFL